jgi:N-acetylmuramoyl-L-alanine amidase
MARGWRDIGYHYVVCLDGRIELGRELGDIGSHAKGHNAKSIGVCYVGGIGEDGEYDDTRTQEQRESLEILLATLVRIFPGAEIIGHRDVANRACPCFDAKEEYKWL